MFVCYLFDVFGFFNLSLFLPADHHSIYIGVPEPRSYRRKRRRRHSSVSSHDITDMERGTHRDRQRHERYESEDTERYDLEQTEHNLHPPEVSRISENPLAKHFNIEKIYFQHILFINLQLEEHCIFTQIHSNPISLTD